MVTLGHFLKQKRKDKSITLRELANMTSLSYSLISRYEQGSRNPNLFTLQRLREALALSSQEFQYVLKTQGNNISECTLEQKGGVKIVWRIIRNK